MCRIYRSGKKFLLPSSEPKNFREQEAVTLPLDSNEVNNGEGMLRLSNKKFHDNTISLSAIFMSF